MSDGSDPRLIVRYLTCCVCGEEAGRFKQHYNRDDGFGICRRCVIWLRGRGISEAEMLELYGVEGVNYAGPSQAEQA